MSIANVMEWSDELSVGIQEIDEQHRFLVDLVNQINATMLATNDAEAIRRDFDRLLEYTRTHFVVEESLMRILGYPDYETHKSHHEGLLAQVLQFKQRLDDIGRVSRVDLMDFLKHWLIEHIKREDRLYSEHFLSRGAQRTWLNVGWLKKFWH
ncbi:hemerythrin [Plasticicumulans lactativorans]|uniref:Hemerythrin n=1 Tax=Plasticicumulans lactativorans TaxID=1133106 RepID=A0A4R2L034_9GAMM|nr:bacteriohemerythrin [Plasticicumulans lactativorans]TCO79573.1 hemerythrin [Plasticicumulans lactativorans]